MVKRRLFVNADGEWAELNQQFKDLSNKQKKSTAGSSPNSPRRPDSTPDDLPVSTSIQIPGSYPDSDKMEMKNIESSSSINSTNTSFTDLTLSGSTSSSSESELSPPPEDVIDIDINPNPTEDTMAVDTPSPATASPSPPPVPKDCVISFCTIKFSEEKYYLDCQTPFTDPNLFFDLTQDPILWVDFFKRHPTTVAQGITNPQNYIYHCLKLMVNRSGNLKDLLACIMFANFKEDYKGSYYFWTQLYNMILNELPFRNEAGKEIVYVARIEMEGGLYKGCWNKELQEHLEDNGLLEEFVYFSVTVEKGFEWADRKLAEEFIRGETFVNDWVVELPRNEYYY